MKIRKLFFAILTLSVLFGIGSGVVFAYDDGGLVNRKEISGGYPSDAVRIYQLVRFGQNGDSSVQLSSGDVVVWDCVSDDGITVGLVTTVGSADAVAGVVVSTTIPTSDSAGTSSTEVGRRNWGYIQIYGYNATVNITAGPATAGQSLKAADLARYATARTTSNQANPLGFAYDTSSSGQSEAFIQTR